MQCFFSFRSAPVSVVEEIIGGCPVGLGSLMLRFSLVSLHLTSNGITIIHNLTQIVSLYFTCTTSLHPPHTASSQTSLPHSASPFPSPHFKQPHFTPRATSLHLGMEMTGKTDEMRVCVQEGLRKERNARKYRNSEKKVKKEWKTRRG